MGAVSKIAWTDSTFNPWIGCQRVSPGCENCYAEGLDKRARYGGHENWGPTAPRFGTMESYWQKPAKWDAEAAAADVRRRVFVGSMCDWLERRPDLVERRQRLCREVIPATPHLDYLMLTKRPENARDLVPPEWLAGGWPPNVWFGFTAEDQEWFDRRWPHVRDLPAPVLWCSYEPALGPIDFGPALPDHVPVLTIPADLAIDQVERFRAMVAALPSRPQAVVIDQHTRIDWTPLPGSGRLAWVVFGGESGAHARDCDLAWGRAARDQCAAHGVAFFCKQMGAQPLIDGPPTLPSLAPARVRLPLAIDRRAGTAMDEWPDDLRIRQFPTPLVVTGGAEGA